MKYVLSVTLTPLPTLSYETQEIGSSSTGVFKLPVKSVVTQEAPTMHILAESKDVTKLNNYYVKVRESIQAQYPYHLTIFNIDTVMEEEDL